MSETEFHVAVLRHEAEGDAATHARIPDSLWQTVYSDCVINRLHSIHDWGTLHA